MYIVRFDGKARRLWSRLETRTKEHSMCASRRVSSKPEGVSESDGLYSCQSGIWLCSDPMRKRAH